MKPKLYSLFLTALISLTVVSCKTASKLYERGDYDQAVELAAKKLQKDPDDQKLRDVLQKAYDFAVDDHESQVRTYSESNNELKWEWIYAEYASLQKLYEAIYRLPSVYSIVNPVNYSSYLITYAEKAGDIRYDRGLTFMNNRDKAGYRLAYREFQSALRFQPGHRDYVLKLNEAYESAVTNVIVLPMQQYGGFVYSSYSVGGDNLDDKLIRDLQYSSGSDFVRFYSAWDARSKNIRMDKEIELRLVNAAIGMTRDNRNTRRVSKEIIVKETIYKPDSVVKEYAKVYADITTTNRILSSEARLEIAVRDYNGRWLWNEHVQATHTWSTEFSTYSGDERALSETEKQLVNRRREFAPPDSEVMRCLVEELSNNAAYRIRNYTERF